MRHTFYNTDTQKQIFSIIRGKETFISSRLTHLVTLKRIQWLWRQRERTLFHSVTSTLHPATRLRVHPWSCQITSIISGKQREMIHLLFWAAFMSLECRQVCQYSIRSSLLGCVLSSLKQGRVGAMRDQTSDRFAVSIYTLAECNSSLWPTASRI